MEKLSSILTSYLIRKNIITTEQSCIYQYGFHIGLEVCLNTIISILIAVLCHMEWEAVVFFAVFMLLRAYAGGLHLNTYISCLISSCISLLVLLLIVKYIDIDNSLSLGIMCISLLLVKFLSPVQDINRPLTPDEIKKFDKKLNYSIVGIVILAVTFYFFQLDKLLMMISVTTLFMVCVLILGKFNYEKCVRKSRRSN
ncbi:accessory gene regulator ArgB-like protein [Clostridium sp.]|jgi:accessory gene regulator B|uniref:accessory gene regulator ArgB-like protein n=1 Tax=Clostridium sp. TaxID=1506 RepID=UPI0039F59E90